MRDCQWLTTGEVASRLGYSIPWVRDQINQGRLPARQFQGTSRRSIRVLETDLDHFIHHWMPSAARD